MNCRGCIRSAVGLVHFQAVNEPVHVCERARVVLHIALTGRCKCSAFCRAGPHGSRPITAEGSIEDLILRSVFKVTRKRVGRSKISRSYNLLILKVAVNITAAFELRNRSSPRGWFWDSIGDVGWRSISGEEPNINHVARPFCSDQPPAIGIKARAIESGVLTLDVAASI